jgi:uncharacterized RDD family membrane protein YckC
MTGFRTVKIDSLQGALTPEGIEFVLFPAGILARACAWGIDQLAQWAIISAVTVTANLLKGAFGIWLWLIFLFCVDWFYHVICELAFRGQSPGKRLVGIRVVRADGSPVGPSSSFLRNLLRFADTFFFFCPIALITMISSPGFRRLGDWAGNTLVVYAPKVRAYSGRRGSSWLEGFNPIVPAVPLSYEEKQAVLIFARRYPLLGEARANEIAGVYAGSLREGGAAKSGARARARAEAEAEAGSAEPVSDAAYLLGIARMLSGNRPADKAAKGDVP